MLALAPDLSMIGYPADTRVGRRSYITIHTYTLPLLLGAVGFRAGGRRALLAAVVWTDHIGGNPRPGLPENRVIFVA